MRKIFSTMPNFRAMEVGETVEVEFNSMNTVNTYLYDRLPQEGQEYEKKKKDGILTVKRLT